MSNSIHDKTFALFDNPINAKLIAELDKIKAKIHKFPPIEAERITLEENSTASLKNFKRYDWIIFTDVLAVDFFLENLEETGVDFYELDETRVCALGETVSDRLRFAQLHADVIPNRIDAKTVLAALKSYAAEKEFEELKFLVIKEVSLDNKINNELIEAHAEAAELPIYRIKLRVRNEITRLKTLLKGGAIDEFIFSAPIDFIALKCFFNEEPLANLLADIKVSAADTLTVQTLREHGVMKAGLFRLDKIDTV